MVSGRVHYVTCHSYEWACLELAHLEDLKFDRGHFNGARIDTLTIQQRKRIEIAPQFTPWR